MWNFRVTIAPSVLDDMFTSKRHGHCWYCYMHLQFCNVLGVSAEWLSSYQWYYGSNWQFRYVLAVIFLFIHSSQFKFIFTLHFVLFCSFSFSVLLVRFRNNAALPRSWYWRLLARNRTHTGLWESVAERRQPLTFVTTLPSLVASAR